jgi:hypothetical protein
MIEVKAPHDHSQYTKPKVFLAGSIEMGAAVDWQKEVAEALSDLDAVLLNPRRDDFDPDAEQSIHDDYFRGQVEWELHALEQADAILLYFAPGTKSPISLLELGLFGRTGKLVVCCPEGFWRKGNVDIVCNVYEIERVETLDEAMESLRARLREEG